MTQSIDVAIASAMARPWFYPFEMPDGRVVPSSHEHKVDAIHTTRGAMLDAFLAQQFPGDRQSLSAIDLACHQGYYSMQLARGGFGRVVGVDVRADHVADTELIARIYGFDKVTTKRSDVFALDRERDGQSDLVLMFGLLYHLENPIGALRVARALTRRALVIETQVVPHMSGMVDWGSYEYVRPLKGVFGIIDELDETHAPEASVTGICLAPSTEGLVWILRSIGFSDVRVLEPPAGGYEQLVHRKRVMVAAIV